MKFFGISLILFVFFSCVDPMERMLERELDLMEIPVGFPDVPFPSDNGFTEDRWLLGKRLFYDPALSRNSEVSCSSCHLPELAFSDHRPVSTGVDQLPGVRNAPSLANIGYHPYLMREGGVPSLEAQVLVPIQEHNEFDFNILLIVERLEMDMEYVEMSRKAYGRDLDPFVLTRAIACFERSLISGMSDFDLFSSHGELHSMTESAIRGMDLFFSERAQCSICHSGFNFTNYEFENNGLYSEYLDEGRYALTKEDADLALFKVPGLRNVELTAPYMHDGSLGSLEAVLDHYISGGAAHVNKSPLVKKLDITESEKR